MADLFDFLNPLYTLIMEAQSGIRIKKESQWITLYFETFIKEGFLNREHVVSIFFDRKKAYDTTWKYEIMNGIDDWAYNNGLKFSQSKTVCVHFCRGRDLHQYPNLVLYNNFS